MKKQLLVLSFCLFASFVFSQDNPAYQLYNAKGKKVSFQKMIAGLSATNIVLFGEFHNNPISHWLQLEVTTALHSKAPLVLGAEMFEQDNQDALNQYLAGSIKAKTLDSMARLWKNYPTDYAPLVNFAKDQKIVFAATNVPRKFASLVAKGGFGALDTLNTIQKSWMAPLPIAYDPELPGYKKMIEMMGGHGGENLPKAQAIKDATMAHFILKNYQTGKIFIHFNGAYHSDHYEGIGWYLKNQNPNLKIGTITTVSQKNVKALEEAYKGKADFIICVPENMTTTY